MKKKNENGDEKSSGKRKKKVIWKEIEKVKDEFSIFMICSLVTWR